MKIWLDTDIGGDIDDALAVLLAISSENAELVGVSTVFENTAARAKIAKKLLTLGGRGDVPVYAGEGKPLRADRVFHERVDCNALPKTYVKELFEDARYEPRAAVEALREALERCNDLCVVTLGALTNVARLILDYPESAAKIKQLNIMGAAANLNRNEFNLTCDPEAADVVFSSEILKKIVTLDVTFRCALNRRQIARIKACKSDCVRAVVRMSEMWNHGMILHDPLALATALSDEFVRFRHGNLKVELAEGYSRGKCADLCDFNWNFPARADMLVSESVRNSAFTAYYVDQICLLDEKLTKKSDEKGGNV